METIKGKGEQFHTIAPERDGRGKMIAIVGTILIVLVAIGVYVYIRNNSVTNQPVHITQAEIDSYNQQVESEPTPAYTSQQVATYTAQVTSAPQAPAYTQSQLDMYTKQITSAQNPIIDSK